MRLEKHNADEMTPLERIYAYEHGLSYDRIPSVPFIGNVRCKVGGMTPEEYWDSAENMVKAELMSYQRFGFDRLGIGPNTRGISDALADQVPEKKQGSLVLDDYSKLHDDIPTWKYIPMVIYIAGCIPKIFTGSRDAPRICRRDCSC